MSSTQTRTASTASLLTHTSDKYWKAGVIHDAVFESTPLLRRLRSKGMRTEGGTQISVNVIAEKNGTVDSYTRYEDLDQAPQDPFRRAVYNWAQYHGAVTVAGIDEFQNSGAEQIQNLVRDETKVLSLSFADRISQDLFDVEQVTTSHVTGNGNRNIIALPHYIQGDPTTGQDVGGIDQSANSWWQNRTKNSATESSGTYSMLKSELINLFHTCSRGVGGSPDLIVVNQDLYEVYIKGMQDQIRYTSGEKATVGFGAVKFFDADLVWDYHVGDPDGGYNFDNASYAGSTGGAAYMINTNFLDLVIGKGKDFKPQGFEKVPGKDAMVNDHLFYGQLVCSNRRKQGVLEDVTCSLTS